MNVGVHSEADWSTPSELAGDTIDSAQFAFGFDVEAQNAGLEREADLFGRLAYA